MGIGDRIKACRKACDMTLEEVAAQVKLSRQTLSRYETGVIKNIPSDVIERLALVLKTTPGHLMGWDDEEKPAPDDEDELAQLKAEVLKELEGASPAEIAGAAAFLRTLKQHRLESDQ